MDLATYLRHHGGDEGQLLTALAAVAPPGEDDIVYLSGSLIEGMGNHRSDLDVYCLLADPSARPAEATFGDVAIRLIEGLAVDIEMPPLAKVRDLMNRLAGFPSHTARDGRVSATAFSPGEIKLLHNLGVGRPLRGRERFEALRATLDPRALSRIGFDYASAYLDLLHADILGMIEVEQFEGARHLLRAYRMHLAGALLAACGETNPAEKWRSLKLRTLQAWCAGLALPGDQSLGAFVEGWFALDETIGQEPPAQSLGRLLHMTYALVPWALDRFYGGGVLAPEAARGIDAPARSEGSEPPLPALRLDCRLGRDGRGIWVTAIRSPDVLYINTLAHEAVLSFDGRTPALEARRRIAARSPAEPYELDGSITDLKAVLTDHALI